MEAEDSSTPAIDNNKIIGQIRWVDDFYDNQTADDHKPATAPIGSSAYLL